MTACFRCNYSPASHLLHPSKTADFIFLNHRQKPVLCKRRARSDESAPKAFPGDAKPKNVCPEPKAVPSLLFNVRCSTFDVRRLTISLPLSLSVGRLALSIRHLPPS